MNLFQIDQNLLSLIDEETGEIMDFEAFEALQMARETKIENTALLIKNLRAEASAIREEEKALAVRRKAAENHLERLRTYLQTFLCGEKWTSPKASVSYRKSNAVEVDDGFLEWAKENAPGLLNYKEPEVSKSAVKEYISAGNELTLARIVETQSIQIR